MEAISCLKEETTDYNSKSIFDSLICLNNPQSHLEECIKAQEREWANEDYIFY